MTGATSGLGRALAQRLASLGAQVVAHGRDQGRLDVDTGMVREGGISPRSSVEEGVRATLRLLVAPGLDGVSGRFFDGTRETEPNPAADDPQARAFVRALTEELLPS